MTKPITPRIHGILDYATVVGTAAAAQLLPVSPKARRTMLALAGGYLGLSALTDYPLSLRRVVPFPAHGAAEAGLGLLLPFLPGLLGFSRDRVGRNALFALTAITAVVAPLTDWDRHE